MIRDPPMGRDPLVGKHCSTYKREIVANVVLQRISFIENMLIF